MNFEFQKLDDGGWYFCNSKLTHGCKMPDGWVHTPASVIDVQKRMSIIVGLSVDETGYIMDELGDESYMAIMMSTKVFIGNLCQVKVMSKFLYTDVTKHNLTAEQAVSFLRQECSKRLLHEGMRWAAGFTDTQYEGMIVYG